MIRIERTNVSGFEAAIRGMRNPMNSHSKSDTEFNWLSGSLVRLGENDLKLMKSLSNAGNDHAKFLRMINVTVDITAPLYWWKEFDTYKVGTVANSCSTMHKIHAKRLTLEDFSCEHLEDMFLDCLRETISVLNKARDGFECASKEERPLVPANDYWWQMIQLLPSSYNQKRTVQLNYQVLKSMYFARRNHKLDEWHDFCAWAEGLPYFKEICLGEEK